MALLMMGVELMMSEAVTMLWSGRPLIIAWLKWSKSCAPRASKSTPNSEARPLIAGEMSESMAIRASCPASMNSKMPSAVTEPPKPAGIRQVVKMHGNMACMGARSMHERASIEP